MSEYFLVIDGGVGVFLAAVRRAVAGREWRHTCGSLWCFPSCHGSGMPRACVAGLTFAKRGWVSQIVPATSLLRWTGLGLRPQEAQGLLCPGGHNS